MKERPILFSAPMVRAILDGTKTQTRRVVKWIGDLGEPSDWCDEVSNPTFQNNVGDYRGYCPYGIPGDRLWVRETWKVEAYSGRNLDTEKQIHEYTIAYRATKDLGREGLSSKTFIFDGPQVSTGKHAGWKPSIHMNRRYSRILLEVVSVRVERLQDISEEDAKAEGATPSDALLTGGFSGLKNLAYRLEYKNLWNRINGPGSWDANPWVWVIEFKRLEPE